MPQRCAFRLLAAVLLAGCCLASAKEKSMLKDKYVKVNGVRLHYVTAGKGPLILFLHGFPEFWYEWKNQLIAFGKDHQAVAPDMRGYNLSTSRRSWISTRWPLLWKTSAH